jgi:hypothetical protein
MAAKLPFKLTDATMGPGMSLVVVDPDGDDSEVKTSGEAADYLAASWKQTLDVLAERELVRYTPEVVIRAGEGRALVINDDLGQENDVVALLLADEDRRKAKPSEVGGELYLYAVVSDTAAGRVAMIKKKNPTKRARGGKALFGAGDELRLLDDDPWELDPLFDLVVSSEGGYALNTHFFEQLFADADRLKARIRPWVDDIAGTLPMSAHARDVLVSRCDASPRLRRRLRSIAHRGHIARISVADVRRHVREMDLTPATFVRNGKLVVSDDNVEELLRILNEDLDDDVLEPQLIPSGNQDPEHQRTTITGQCA